MFLRLRWPETDGKPVCPDCGCMICYACRRDFSITSGILPAWHKPPLRSSLLAVSAFCDEVKGYKIGGVGKTVEVDRAYLGG